MNKVKFIHCADIHFDTMFSSLPPAKAAVRRDELRINFSRIIELCLERAVDVLLIAGDLFDGTRVTDETVHFLLRCFERIPGVQVFISPGNHDPYMPGSRYEITSWPSNVHIFRNKEISKTCLNGINVNVYGAGFVAPYTDRSMLDGFQLPAEDSSAINLMVLHGELLSNGQSSSYAPLTVQSLAQTAVDYVALGHRHMFTEPEKAGSAYYSYCGTPEGRGFDELGEKGILYGEINKYPGQDALLHWEFLPCSKRIYREVTVDLTGCTTHEEVCQRIHSRLGETDDLYKVLLTGALKDGFLLDLNILISRFTDQYFFIRFRDMTSTEVDVEALAKETLLKGIFAKRMLARIEDARKKQNTKEEKLYTDALTIGLKAFEGEVPIYDNQID